MPIRVMIPRHHAGSLAATEEVLASAVRVAFQEMRMVGLANVPCCSVSSARLQQEVQRRYPAAYEQHIVRGLWGGKWHHFVEEMAGLRCFLYTALDYIQATHLTTHIAVSELRCCMQGDPFSLVRLSDEAVGSRLQSTLLEPNTLNHHCWVLVRGALDAVKPPGRPRWMEKPAKIPHIVQFLNHLEEDPRAGRRPGSERLRRCAAHELTKLLTESDDLVRHMSGSQLRRRVAQCLCTWSLAPAPCKKLSEMNTTHHG
uniref:Uncharacterized protein n=1 Tax=Trypanosoma congolense (strain IL3000) TaxID=1068625 RepID=G0USB7_TRYCI|nr:conserved hypothetical protein [Trypanosoma congolense IL3000]